MRKTDYAARFLLLLLAAFTLLAGTAAAESYGASTMRLLRWEGSVQILDPEGEARFVMENARFAKGESLETGAESLASVGLDEERIVTLDEESLARFSGDGSRMLLTLSRGTLLLDVRDKLDENEALDIETSNVTVGIRGTAVYVSESGGASLVGMLEGETEVIVREPSGVRRLLTVSAGQLLTVSPGEDGTGFRMEYSPLTRDALPAFILKQAEDDPVLNGRITLTDGGSPAAPGSAFVPGGNDWTFDGAVSLVAQSASKLYDGTPLSCPSDVLVSGLPACFSVEVSASGSQTDAGTSENAISSYRIFYQGADVTGRFTAVSAVNGTLTVNKAPLTVWTGSAAKPYDGTPLTCEEAEFRASAASKNDDPNRRNISCVSGSSAGSETMYCLTGTCTVYAVNPLTGALSRQKLAAGQKVNILLDGSTVRFAVTKLSPVDLPPDVLRQYADHPDLLDQACRETGWNPKTLSSLAAQLKDREPAGASAENLIEGNAEVRFTVDTAVTDYSRRELLSNEASFGPVPVPASVRITATGSRTTPGTAGNTYEIAWGSASPDNFDLQENLGRLTVYPPTETASVVLTAASAGKTYDGTPLSDGSFTVTGLPSGYTLSAVVSGSLTDAGTAANTVTSYTILNDSGVNVTGAFPNVSTVSGTLTVKPAPLAVATESASKTYDGTPLTAGASLSGLARGETATAAATGSVTDAGSTANTYTISWGSAKPSNYTVSESLGTLTVKPAALAVTTESASKTYDGTPLTAGASVSGLAGGETASAAATGSVTDAGSAQNTYTLSWGSAKPSNYTVSESLGTLTVNPAALTVTTESASKTYDGSPLTAGASLSGLARGETATAAATGSVTDAGSAKNTYTLSWGSAKPSNYTVSENLGTLTVNPATLAVATESASKTYDGSPLAAGASLSGLAGGETASVTATGTLTDAGSAQNTYTISWGSAKASNYTISESLGTLTVNPASLAVTTGSADKKAYDGRPLTNSEASLSGLVGGETASVTATGTLTDAGSVPNSYAISWGSAKAGNYTVTENLGTLSIGKAMLWVVTNTAEKRYDGTPLTASGSLDGLVPGETVTFTVTGSQTEVGSSLNTYTITWGSAKQSNYTISEDLGILTVEEPEP